MSDIWFLVSIGLIVLLGVVGNSLADELIGFRKQAIQNDCAHYDAKTGDFTWNTPLPK